jgi:hypothetical protein
MTPEPCQYLEQVYRGVQLLGHIGNHVRMLHEPYEAHKATLALLGFDPIGNFIQCSSTPNSVKDYASKADMNKLKILGCRGSVGCRFAGHRP